MKLISFGPRYRERPGLMLDAGILDLSSALPGSPLSWREILDAGRLEEALAILPDKLLDPGEFRLAPPIPDPGKIICLGLNYRDHAEEQNRPIPEKPLLFPKMPSALIGQGESVELPEDEPEVDYEVELAFIISRRARRVRASEAGHYILGYTILNDVTGRKAQRTERQWLRAKGFETFAPCGPWIVTPEEIPDPHNLDLECRVNGELRQKSNTSQLIFRIDYLVEYLSRSMTLEPGDIVSTGTPGGVGVFRNPPVFLRSGDTMRLEIEGIGVLENRIA
ncbi:MAG: fumarylacetoacetate hydrolase family protein [Candidatus Krumholzibacteria bacterium]|jgi:acylpyruvate hydrolase|nr:fumarylacetoacetate hydrolase family protein [Candidatus Krumholzibacteria bacterium]MDP6668559.1 fumarylacetoacetate hydrolase family protein [Candidatus Krumholzibacteria bacterium]MDP6796882.1 fumarylacetoacetate hydrolase family protein [Candidatus Krumholzibacteria bacterium]MDP7021811.1 fumarylacetoacetate hydrolase family protein [Candidatus Krumholzibacteria bacterium]